MVSETLDTQKATTASLPGLSRGRAVRHAAGTLLRRLLVSAIGSITLILLAVFGLSVTTAPEWVSLIFEPFCLLFTPGVFFAMLLSGDHDYTERAVTQSSFWFYLLILFVLLTWSEGRRRRRGLSPTRLARNLIER